MSDVVNPKKPLTPRQQRAVAGVCRMIEAATEMPSLEQMADTASLSRFHFQRLFKRALGISPKAYWEAQRQRRVRQLLPAADTVTEAAYESGYNSGARFYATADLTLGMKPADYRAGGPGVQIRFAVGECSLGSILVAATERGVCAISLGDDPQRLLDDLQGRFPKAQLVGADASFEQATAQVIGLVEQGRPLDSLPLDIQGTAFQQQVWQALTQIPPAEIRSYAQVGQSIGRPTAARAVATACAANPLAVAIPCHRVVRADGGLSGYRWGVERKAELLRRERARLTVGDEHKPTGKA